MTMSPSNAAESQAEDSARDRFVACLLGGAVGDALGAPVEFMSLEKIHQTFGDAGIRDYAPAYGRLGAITDDTQMTLFTAEGMIRTVTRSADRGIASAEAVTGHAYQRWLATQGERSSSQPASWLEEYPGWLFGLKPLHSRRAPGNTCLSALRSARSIEDVAKNDSKGCGAVMRMAPVGLAGWRSGQEVGVIMAMGAKIGRLTHGHPSGYLSAGAFAVIIAEVLRGSTLAEAAQSACRELRAHADHEETLAFLELALRLARAKPIPGTVPAELGEGWVGEEALAIGLYCALVATSLEEGVVLAVNIDGDSDSTGSIAGNVLGAMHGTAAIPERWLQPLELRETITTVAEDLYDCQDWNLYEANTDQEHQAIRRIYARYPPN
jgi:ADP-ribosylglycohydrolase